MTCLARCVKCDDTKNCRYDPSLGNVCTDCVSDDEWYAMLNKQLEAEIAAESAPDMTEESEDRGTWL